MRPEMTGETAKGKSTSVNKRLRPVNWYLAMAQAAATPKMVLSGTAMTVVSSVSLIAAQMLGSVNELKYALTPWLKASTKTTTSGRIKNRNMNSTAMAMSNRRIQAGSAMARRLGTKVR